MTVKEFPGGVEVCGVSHFNPSHTFLCGQCFRWSQEPDGSFTGVALGRVANISQAGASIRIRNSSLFDFENIWRGYLDLDRDYGMIKNALSRDDIMRTAIKYGWGIRILRQDFFECLISFIVSANNNIPRIRGILDRFSEMYGEKLLYSGKAYYAFPKPDRLRGITEADIAPLRAGYRSRYIVQAVNAFNSGEISGDRISSLPLDKARRELRKVCGVGPKVADCILLFSCGKFGAFPVDTWVRRAMHELYGCEGSNAAARGAALFGELSGVAQQYLFYWRRENA